MRSGKNFDIWDLVWSWDNWVSGSQTRCFLEWKTNPLHGRKGFIESSYVTKFTVRRTKKWQCKKSCWVNSYQKQPSLDLLCNSICYLRKLQKRKSSFFAFRSENLKKSSLWIHWLHVKDWTKKLLSNKKTPFFSFW